MDNDKIFHDYGNVVLDIVYNTLTIDIPELYELLFLKQLWNQKVI